MPRTKLAVPALPPQLVSRPRLLALLDGAVRAMVTLVSASAGTGKTLLLAEWVRGRGTHDTAWVSLDSDDNEDDRFWSALLEAMAGCETVPPTSPLRALTLPPDPSSDPRFLAELVNALDELDEPVLLVLDDVHELTDPRPLHGLETLLRHHPAGLRLVLAARHDPLLPLGRLRLTDQLTEVRAADLRFSAGEAGALLDAAGIDLDTAQLGDLLDQTEGWAAGLRLAALSLAEGEHQRVLDDLAANDRVVGGYLVDEVLSGLPPELGEFLAAISVCEQVSAPLAAELSGRADAGALLDSLTRLTSLVTPVDTTRTWYHVHALLRSHLLADLTRQTPGRAARLHAGAAGWFAADGQPARALAHAIEAGDAATAGDLATRFATALVLDGDHDLVRRLLEVAGQDLVARDSRLALVAALLRLEHADPAGAERDLATADAAWPADASAELTTLRRLVLARRAQLGGDVDEQLLATDQFDHGHEDDPLLDALTRLCRGTALLAAGRAPAAREHLDAATALAREHGHEYLTAQCLTALAALAAATGDHGRVPALAGEADRLGSRHGWRHTVTAATADALRGYGALLAADPAAGLEHATRAATVTDELADDPAGRGPRLLVETVRGAAEFELGEWTTGARRLQRAPLIAGTARLPDDQVALTAVLGHRAALLLGWGQAAGQLLDWAQAAIPDAGEIELMRARAQLALGRHHAVDRIIAPLLEGTARIVVGWTVIDAWLLSCEAALGAGEREPALRALRRALGGAERLDVLHPVVFARADVVELLTAGLGSFGALDPFAQRAFATLRGLDLPPLPVPLTPRERGILRMLPTARSLDEIAKDLTVSPNTVKTHVRAIYAKLGVTRRRDAVEVASERGLLAEAAAAGNPATVDTGKW